MNSRPIQLIAVAALGFAIAPTLTDQAPAPAPAGVTLFQTVRIFDGKS
jgi:hypothetical protein